MSNALSPQTGGSQQNSRSSVPLLRQDLRLLPGPAGSDGVPTWTIHDPVRNRYHRISQRAFDLLTFWHLGDGEKIVNSATRASGVRPSINDIEWLTGFLRTNFLVQVRTPEATEALERITKASKLNWLYLLLSQYLFFRIPLLRPQRFLDVTSPFVNRLGSRQVLLALLFLGAIGLFLVARQWDGFQSTFLHFFSWDGMVWYGTALLLTKVLHEFGHAYTATRYGCRVPTMGVALLVMWPVLYTDTTDAWRLRSKRQRLLIGAAGMATELGIALLATFAWSFLPEGPAKSAAFLIATVTWVMTLGINLNPFMRFDGYYLLSDALDIPNLQDRAFTFARWWLREQMFGFGEEAPEQVTNRRAVFLVVYSISVWVYRLILFTGIALLVYSMFFKVLGIILFLAEIILLILLPVIKELREIYSRRSMVQLNLKVITTSALGLLATFMLVYPFENDIEVPALLEAQERQIVVSPVPSELAQISVSRGQRVTVGQPLFTLYSDKIEFAISKMERSIEMRELLVRREAAGGKERAKIHILRQDLESDRARLRALEEKKSNLTVTAQVSGMVIEMNPHLRPGTAVNDRTQLATIIGTNYSRVVGYVAEEDLAAARIGTLAVFIPDNYALKPVSVTVTDVSPVNSPILTEAHLASVHGGGIAVEKDRQGRLIPIGSQYKIVLKPVTAAGSPNTIVKGVVKMAGPARSTLDKMFKSVVAVLIRETNF